MNVKELIKLDIPVILASASARRRQLLSFLNIDFKVEIADIDENISLDLPPEEYCKQLAFSKAKIVALHHTEATLIIGADTIVYLNGEIINKPSDREEAYSILSQLSGNTHKVYTGLALINSVTMDSIVDYQVSDVTFRKLSDKEIWAYIDSGSPMDKAGAYGIQDDFGAVFVQDIRGCYYNIVGLPLQLLYSNLVTFIEKYL
ncbi:MAG TPA: Maf family protein [Candidatus Kapabacteria bacterium]|nr:Maf family protein [Candidatus Kapabacteria bacterium]